MDPQVSNSFSSSQCTSMAEYGISMSQSVSKSMDMLDRQQEYKEDRIIRLLDMQVKQAKKSYSDKEYVKALEAFNKTISMAPSTWTNLSSTYGYRSATLFMLGRYLEAIEDCSAGIKLDEKLIKLHTRKARAYVRLGLFEEAEDVYNSILKLKAEELIQYELKNNSNDTLDSLETDKETKKKFKALEQHLEMEKYEAHMGIEETQKLQKLLEKLYLLEDDMNFPEAFITAHELMKSSPYCHIAIICKANALCELKRYDEAKVFIEWITVNAHESIREKHLLCADTAINLPIPSESLLQWKEQATKGGSGSWTNFTIEVDTDSVVSIILSMGPLLSKFYYVALKNISPNRNCCERIMKKLLVTLTSLQDLLSIEDLVDSWSWINQEIAKLQNIIKLKKYAEEYFEKSNYEKALSKYNLVVKADFSATKWKAIFLTDRAKVHMLMSNVMEALIDVDNALENDLGYPKAYKVRARVYKILHMPPLSMQKYGDAIRDFMMYLSFTPAPLDSQEVEQEMKRFRDDYGEIQDENFKRAPGDNSYGGAASSFSGGLSSACSSAEFVAKKASKNRFLELARKSTGYDNTSRPSSIRIEKSFSSSRDANDPAQPSPTSPGPAPCFPESKAKGATAPPNPPKPVLPPRPTSTSQFNVRPASNRQPWGKDGVPPAAPPAAPARPTSAKIPIQKAARTATPIPTTPPPPPKSIPQTLKPVDNTPCNHYELLGLNNTATDRDIKMAYRKMALLYHPDKNKAPGAEEKFKTVNYAHSVLRDRESRRSYDITLKYPI